jgi:pilus assembly protein CpaB
VGVGSQTIDFTPTNRLLEWFSDCPSPGESSMNQRLTVILLSAFLIAAGGSYVVYRLVGKQLRDYAKNQATQIVVAASDLEIGAVIKATDLKTAALVGAPPKDAILKTDLAVGRGVITPIYAGEPVIEKRLAPVGSGGGLAATIPAGMRACAVKVDEVVGVAGFVLPGMHVDVLISGGMPGDLTSSGTQVRTLLQNIEVLSAGKNFQRDNDGKPAEVAVVNLLVTPDQAEVLSLASNQTHIQLVLRNPIDHQISKPPGTDLANLFGHPPSKAPAPASGIRRVVAPPVAEKAPPPPPPLPPPFVVEVLNGGKTTEQAFSSQGVPQ